MNHDDLVPTPGRPRSVNADPDPAGFPGRSVPEGAVFSDADARRFALTSSGSRPPTLGDLGSGKGLRG